MAGQIIPLYPDSGTDAARVQGIPVSVVDPTTGQILQYDLATRQYVPVDYVGKAGGTFTGNVTLNGTANAAPNQTAASGSSLMTRDLVDARIYEDTTTLALRQYLGWDIGPWGTVGTNPASVYDGNSKAGCRMVGTTSTAHANASGGGIKYTDGGVTGGPPFLLTSAWDIRFVYSNYYSVNPSIAFFFSVRNGTAFWTNSSIGLFYVPQPASSWASATAYAQWATINVGGIVYVCSTAGTSGGSAPTWGTSINGTTNDNTAVWRNLGPHTSNKWALATVSAAGAISLTDTGVAFDLTAANQVLRVRSNGSTVYASVNGSVDSSVSIGSLTNATPYFMVRNDNNTGGRVAALLCTIYRPSF